MQLKIDYPALRGDFLNLLRSKKLNERYVRCMLSFKEGYSARNLSLIVLPQGIFRREMPQTDGDFAL